MTSNSDKIRAVVLAALMVFSVFAGTVALSGSAAAVTDNNVSLGSYNADATTNYTYTGTLEGDGSTANNVTLTLNETDMSGASLETLAIGGSEVGGSVESVDGSTATFSINPTAINSQEFTITVSGVNSPSSAGTYGANVSFLDNSTELDSGSTDFTVYTPSNSLVFAGQKVVYNTAQDEDGSGTYVLRSGSATDGDDDDTALRTLSVGDDDLIEVDTGTLDTGNYYITNDGEDSADLAFEVIQQDFSASFEDDSVGNQGSSATTTLELDSDNRAEEFDVNVTVEDADIDDEELVDIFTYDEDNGTQYNVTNADLDDDEDEDGIRLLGVEGGDEIDVNFDEIDAATYNFTFQVNDTEVQDSAEIEVTEADEGALSFNESTLEEEQGDIATINVSFNQAATEGHLVVGDYSDSGYQANITLEDGDEDGSVTVKFNTYTAGTGPDGAPIVWAEGDDDTAELQNRNDNYQLISDLLDTTSDGYQLAVSQNTGEGGEAFEETLDDPDELGTLFLEERGMENMTSWTAPSGVYDDYDDLEDAADVQNAIEDGVITESNDVAFGDVAVFQIQASGLSGIIEDNRSNLTGYLAPDGEEDVGLEFAIEGEDRANQPTRVVDLSSASSVDVVTTENNQVFLLVDTPTDGLDWQNGDNINDDTGLTANFTIEDNRLLDSNDDDDDENVEDGFTHVEPDAEFDEDPITVPASEDATISGSTNVAPGTEMTVRVQSTDSEARFIKTNDSVVVEPDGTWNAMFDFTEDATVGDEFDATARDYGGDDVTVSGEVVEANETDTPAETTETGTPAENETTEPPAETTEPPAETTEPPAETTEPPAETTTTTPGFTGVLAVLALIGAALVALRRDN